MTGCARVVSPELVERIVEMRTQERLSANKIAERLTAEGVRTPGGGATWNRQTVGGVLAREGALDQYDPRYDRREDSALRTQLDLERAMRDRSAAAFERRFFDAVTRDLAPVGDLPEPQRHSEVVLAPVHFTDEQLRWW